MAGEARLKEAVAAFQRGDLARARNLAEQAGSADRSPKWQHLLGLIDCRSGSLESGVERLRSACEADPQNVAYRVMLVRALVDSGRAGEALEAAVPPAGTTAAELALWHARAQAADAAENADAAQEAWRHVCAAMPQDWRAWSSYGNALLATARWDKASEAFRRATALNPSELSLRRMLATALGQAGRTREAADELLLWADAAPPDAGTRILLARLLADIGRDEESLEQLDKGVQLATGERWSGDHAQLLQMAKPAAELNVALLRELARLLERTSRIGLLRNLLAESANAGVAPEQLGYPAAAVALKDGEAEEAKRLLLADGSGAAPLHWHWLMARTAEALGDSQMAFAEAEAMNRSVPDYDEWRRKAGEHIAWVRGLSDIVTAPWGARLKPLDKGKEAAPALLVGFPRSGTTLLDTFLMGHPRAEVLEEIPTLHAVEGILGKLVDLPDKSPSDLARARAAYFAEMRRHVLADFDGLIVDKLPLKLLGVPFVHAILPDTRIVFAQRHPCDCVLSCFMQPFALNNSMACFLDVRDAAVFYDAVMTYWTRVREVLPLKVHTVVYEKLVAEPESVLRPLVDFLGLEWDERILDHRATAQARGAISTPSYDQVVQPLSTRASGRWRRYEKQLAPVLPLLLPWAKRLGYAQ